MKSRKLESKLFTDPFIESLTLKQKWIYLFYLFNSSVNWLGCYEITDRYVMFGCGGEITNADIEEAKEVFRGNNKILFVDNYVIIKNSEKYENHLSNRQLMRTALKQFLILPENIKKEFISFKPMEVINAYRKGFSDLGYDLGVGYSVGYNVGYAVGEVIRNKNKVISNKKEEIRNKNKEPESLKERLERINEQRG